jgi:hypothetical protein
MYKCQIKFWWDSQPKNLPQSYICKCSLQMKQIHKILMKLDRLSTKKAPTKLGKLQMTET